MTRSSRRPSPRRKRGWTFRHVRVLSCALLPCILTVTALPAFANTIVSSPPAGTDSFYAKYLDAGGVAILGSAQVDDQAVVFAHDIVSHMLSKRPDLASAMARQHAKVAIVAINEVFTDIPEMRRWKGQIDPSGRPWERRCGAGGVKGKGVTVICERILLNRNDPFHGKYAALVHEFGHAIQNLALDAGTLAAIDTAYQHAKEANLFAQADGHTPSHMMTNAQEFFAEGSAIWFNGADPTNPSATPAVATRAGLKRYDRELYEILATIYPDDDWVIPHSKTSALGENRPAK